MFLKPLRVQRYTFFAIYENKSSKNLNFVTSICQNLLPSEVRRYFPPGFGVPFVDRSGPCVVMEPHLRLADHEEQILVGGIPFDLGSAPFLAHPGERGDGVGIDHPGEVVFLDIRQPQHQGKKTSVPVSAITPRNSITPGLPLHAASTARAGNIGFVFANCESDLNFL